MTRRTKTLLISTMTLMLCIMLISAATFALYSQETRITNHLEAGKLELQLWRVGVAQHTLNDAGYLETVTRGQGETTPSGNAVYQNFSGSVNDNFFGLTDQDLKSLVPGAWYETTLKLVNNGDVAFTFSINIVAIQASSALQEQVTVSIIPCDENGNAIGNATSKTLSELVANSVAVTQVMDATATEQYVKVKIAFSDKISEIDENGVNFDLLVKADQLVSKP